MNRRDTLKGLGFVAAAGALGMFRKTDATAAAQEKRSGRLTIRDVEIWQVSGHREPDTLKMQWQVSPASIYQEEAPPALPETKPSPTQSSPVLQQTLYLKILTREGAEGFYGMIDPEEAVVIDRQLRPILIGQDPLAGEILWEKMFRSNRHSRAGHFMMAISALDNALWDLRGKVFNMPVYRLLGGPSRDRIEAYASCLGHRLEPDEVRRVSAGFRDQGYRFQKWFFTHGPDEEHRTGQDAPRSARHGSGDPVRRVHGLGPGLRARMGETGGAFPAVLDRRGLWWNTWSISCLKNVFSRNIPCGPWAEGSPRRTGRDSALNWTIPKLKAGNG